MSAELMKSKFVRRPYCNYLRTLEQISFNFSCCFPGAIRPVFEQNAFSNFFFAILFSFSLTWMRTKNFNTLLLPQITFESFQTFSTFFRSGPHTSTGLDFKFLSFCFFTNLFHFRQYETPREHKLQNTAPSITSITFEYFQKSSEFCSRWSSQKYCFGFLKFWVWFLTIFFSENEAHSCTIWRNGRVRDRHVVYIYIY